MNGDRPLAMVVAYDGTDFAGWQRQPELPTIQGVLERCLATVHGVPPGSVALAGAGRTDAGVHALGQVASWIPPTERDPDDLLRALGRMLPPSIAVLSVDRMPRGFHARRTATGKVYRYRVITGRRPLPFESRWAWAVPGRLDVAAMRAAAGHLVGRHDFAAFANAGSSARTSVRTLRRLSLRAHGDGRIEIEAEADGFLWRMVRILAGFLVQVGMGRREPGEAAEVLASRDRAAAGTAAPARGLCLVRVLYGEGPAPGPALNRSSGRW